MSARFKPAPDKHRQRLLDAIEAAGDTLKSVSEALGHDHAYVHQYVYRGSPQRLGETERRILARRYQIPEEELMPEEWVKEMSTDSAKVCAKAGMNSDAVEGSMSPTRKAIRSILRLPLPSEERLAILNDFLESDLGCLSANEAAEEGVPPRTGRETS